MDQELNEKIQSLSSSQKRRVIAKSKLLYERIDGGYVLWDSYNNTRLKAFGVQQHDVSALIKAFIVAVRSERRLLLELCQYGKADINEISKIKIDEESDANAAFKVEVYKITSAQGTKYCKVNFYNVDGRERKYGISIFFSDALTYIRTLNLWENCFDDHVLHLSSVSVPENYNFF